LVIRRANSIIDIYTEDGTAVATVMIGSTAISSFRDGPWGSRAQPAPRNDPTKWRTSAIGVLSLTLPSPSPAEEEEKGAAGSGLQRLGM